jgi:ornithine cyclodeaminase
MRIISDKVIRNLGISPVTCVKWVKESLSVKSGAELPVKMGVHPSDGEFFTSMPCLLPPLEDNVNQSNNALGLKRRYFGLKLVHRLLNAVPSLGSDLLLYDASTGDLLALMGADWITAMRTGALSAAAAKELRKSDAKTYGIMGLGNTARATLQCLLEQEPQSLFEVKLLRYKDQHQSFIERFKDYANVSFSVCESINELASTSDVLFSCITHAEGNVVENANTFKEGITIIPVHTQGFMNCDTVFDRVFGDDTNHVKGFRYFSQFKGYNEIGEVFAGRDQGRENDKQRIIDYNYGLGLHDVVFAAKIFELTENQDLQSIELYKETRKFWI